ncbi:hypothetical protein BJY24_000029 [Nocardia transvalensis]|uniref:Uncharacterized protein n=1 Tax=Nocardia transvalensis TaxID=37333 RepID=A0A7W9UFJ1_9NOCA|nr:hypothetical protein [Nocardia transvalensis]MBB5911162.1 hypothetical protein [Nocardia transvalensis]
MFRRIWSSAVWEHVVRALVSLGAASCGSVQVYTEYVEARQLLDQEWDWSVPYQWFETMRD